MDREHLTLIKVIVLESGRAVLSGLHSAPPCCVSKAHHREAIQLFEFEQSWPFALTCPYLDFALRSRT